MGKLSLSKMVCIVFAFCAATAITSPAQAFTTLYVFCPGSYCNGSYPSGLLQGTDGNFYGTAAGDGAHSKGTVFTITPEGTLTTLHFFGGGTDGFAPDAGLVEATDGNLYGTTALGGYYYGTVFEISPKDPYTLTTLHYFDGTQGYSPHGLIQASDVNLYGITWGTSDYGTVFEISPAYPYPLTTLYRFCFQCTDGDGPTSLIQATDGNFYGTTEFGGIKGHCDPYNLAPCGTVFRITAAGMLTTLHRFAKPEGAYPGALIQATDGNFYGTTAGGGAYDDPACVSPGAGCGTVFKMTPNGTLTTLYSFCAQRNCADGANPGGTLEGNQTLLQGSDGNFYGTTDNGGAYGYGTIFKITPGGTLTTVHSFDFTDGSEPNVLLQATDGDLYGTTYVGGRDGGPCPPQGCGTVFRLSLGLPPPLPVLRAFATGSGTVTSTDGDINCPTICSHSYSANTQVTLNASAAQGWTFTGWTGVCNGTDSCVVTMTQNLSITATFTQTSRLTVLKAGTGSGTVTSSDGFINCGNVCSYTYNNGTQVTLMAAPSQGSWFSGWSSCDSTQGNTCTVTMNNNRTVTVTFQPTYLLTVSKVGTGSGTVTSSDGLINCGNVCSYTYNSGIQVTLTATPSPGSSFTSWSGCDSINGNSCTVTMNSVRTVRATFTQITYTLTASKAGTGLGTVSSTDGLINCGNVCSHIYNSGIQVTLTATPSTGSSFTSWSGCDSTNGSTCTVTMNSSRTATATFTLQAGYYKLSVSTSGGGTVTSTDGFINCPGSCNYVYESNTPVTLNATPSSGWTFVGWNGACSGTGACNLTMTQSLSVGASFIFGVAVYNSTLGAPECAVAGRSCDSGPWLLLGKDNMSGGPEPNQPNTIHSSCADGTAGTFHVDESIDRLTVASSDGLNMAQGSIVRVSATVWVADPTQDALDLYYATNANNPTWIYITTLVPKAPGSQTLSAMYRLGLGHLQAVRANFRQGGTKSPCSTGQYDDHDDLVFTVR